MKKRLLALMIIMTAGILVCHNPATMAMEVVVTDIYDQLGIQPAPDLEVNSEHDTSSMAVVRDPSKLASFGIGGLETGDVVELTNFVSNLWKVSHIDSGKSLNVRLKTSHLSSTQP